MDLRYPFPEPTIGCPQRVADGVELLRMPLPFALNHINLWLLSDTDGWALVDTGMATNACRNAWEPILQSYGAERLKTILVTHFHPDHVGLAGWLHQRSGAQVCMSAEEAATARRIYAAADEEHGRVIADFLGLHGLSPEQGAEVRRRGNKYRPAVSELPEKVATRRGGDTIRLAGRDWQLISVSGHSPEHLCAYDPEAGVLIAGDQVLPRITSNVSVGPNMPEADPLREFLESLGRLRDLPADTLVLPSHGLPFVGLRERIDAIIGHHAERLALLRETCRRPCTAAELLPALFRRPLDSHTLFFAMGEAIAHLHYLWHAGEADRQLGADGVYRFSIS
ncbi:glyoxylase-like metal-dependent hydrolase (beta-lactamase superfamily II) [Natronocella acetinitrilica]|uniref:Glyoxylase-like metal-dependent hydrolase (Beta-lactamase superfamily II) n=1 Tax=Natronocella acetinitrilica TaxID=414046 RepID=A0AAE3G822_9GAMM|nr:MBL fold metallo-hydrolase [Natronocella acetinitrilica]MCP1676526.1 glyoxylase-like metal-dependent hydrolase (beta-lactamase superfamily II) [Natronocella acetinitrilica]